MTGPAFTTNGEGYEELRAERGGWSLYHHRLLAYADGQLDSLGDGLQVHHVQAVPWYNSRENVHATEQRRHAQHHLHDQPLQP